MRKLIFFTTCFLGIILAASAQAANFNLSPSSQAFTEGCEEQVDIMIDSEGATTDAANIYVYYDPTEISIVDQDAYTTGTQIQTGDAYQTYVDNTAAGGEIRLTGFTVLGGFSGTRTFGTIVFEALPGVTAATLEVYYISGSTLDSNIAEKDTGLDLLDGVTNGSYTFSTGFCVPDTTAPWVTNASPFDGEENYALDGDVTFDLNDNQSGVDMNSVVITVDGIDYSLAGPNVFSHTGSQNLYSVTVDPIADFIDGVETEISVYGCDIDGNCRTTTWHFNEPPPPPPQDTTPPWVANASPYNGQQSYPLNGNVTFDLRDNQDGVDINSVVVTVDGVDYSLSGPNTFSYGGDVLDYDLTVDPVADFPDLTEVDINVYACDASSNCKNTSWSFNEPPPSCEELYNDCQAIFDANDCTFEEVECPEPVECEAIVCEECEVCEGDEVETEEDVQTGDEVIEIVDETINVPDATSFDLSYTDVSFYALSRRMALSVDANDYFYILPGYSYTVDLDATVIEKEVSSVQWFANSTRYVMSESGDVYTATVSAPSGSAGYPAHLIVTYTDETIERLDYILVVVPYGQITDEETGEPISGATVAIYEDDGDLWNAQNYLQDNPDTTSSSGYYGFMVPSGSYSVTVSKEGYSTVRGSLYTNQIINTSAEMRPLPPTVEQIVESLDEPAAAAGMVIDNIQFALNEVRDVPQVEQVAEIAIPGLVGLALGNLLVLAILLGLLPFLQYLITSPLLLIWRRKRKGWGVVYNAITKLPVDLAIVRLYKIPETGTSRGLYMGQLVQTRVTDKSGRYFFLVGKGSYRIQVTKPGFDFPSEYLEEVKDDGTYLDVYHGQRIRVKEADQTIAANIPVDPVEGDSQKAPFKVRAMGLLRWIQGILAVIGVMVSVAVAIIIPMVLTIVIAVAQVVIYFLVRYLAKPKQVKGWGIVYDKKSKAALSGVVVRIFDHKSNKILETAVTDRKGRYSFLVGPNVYYTRYERDGYKPAEYRPIDFSKNNEPAEVAFDVALEKNGTSVPTKIKTEPKIDPMDHDPNLIQ